MLPFCSIESFAAAQALHCRGLWWQGSRQEVMGTSPWAALVNLDWLMTHPPFPLPCSFTPQLGLANGVPGEAPRATGAVAGAGAEPPKPRPQPDAYEFSIRTPVTPARWKDYDEVSHESLLWGQGDESGSSRGCVCVGGVHVERAVTVLPLHCWVPPNAMPWFITPSAPDWLVPTKCNAVVHRPHCT